MKKKSLYLTVLSIALLLSGVSPVSPDMANPDSSADAIAREAGDKDPQDTQKQKFDYMSSILSRNTKPLGLKENVTLRKWLNQPSIKWAMRSGNRHILN